MAGSARRGVAGKIALMTSPGTTSPPPVTMAITPARNGGPRFLSDQTRFKSAPEPVDQQTRRPQSGKADRRVADPDCICRPMPARRRTSSPATAHAGDGLGMTNHLLKSYEVIVVPKISPVLVHWTNSKVAIHH
jgi:hypothetical protein